MKDVLVIGAGLFGSIIAAAFRRKGCSVIVIDDSREGRGSKPAACLMRPGWFSGLGKAVYEPSLKLLDELYGVQDIEFETNAKVSVKVHWCSPVTILKSPDVQSIVRRTEACSGGWRAITDEGELEAKLLIVAAGVWTSALVSLGRDRILGQAGLACLWPKEKIERPFVRVWAPYKQLVAFNRGDGLWVGEGSSVRAENWSSKSAATIEERCKKAVEAKTPLIPLFGIRPYVKDKPCLLQQTAPNFWAATGGAKNGTIAAGWCAHELLQRAAL